MGIATAPLPAAQAQQGQALRARYRPGKGPLLIFVGRLVEEKGAEDLIRATAQLAADLPDLRTLILGDGPERSALEQVAAELGIRHRVIFAGWIDPTEVRTWLGAADIFVGPSRTAANGWVEAQGLTFVEAMMAGLPVIASRLGGIPDAVIHEQTGLLVDERAPAQIAAAVRRLGADPALGRGLAERGRALAESQFSRENSAQAFSELFNKLC
jgi:glycosyltransferase involved in cell wall biosynthesis